MGNPLSVWTRYSASGASSRLRFLHFFPFLEKAGWDPEHHAFYEERYLQQLYTKGKKDPGALWRGWRRRTGELRRLPQRIPMLVEYELFPYLPWVWEKHFLAGHPYVLNFDDAVFLRYARLPGLSGKYGSLCRHAAGIITANEELKQYFSRFHQNVIKIPTVPPPYPAGKAVQEETLTLVWIGTPVTYGYLRKHEKILRAMVQAVPFRLRIIASSRLPGIPGVPTECFDWSPETEYPLLASAHIGIMPLPDTPFARGKSAYKLIQYAAAGLPAIASDVGENRFVIRHGGSGFLANTPEEWIRALKILSSPAERQKMAPVIGESAARFSREKAGEELIRFLAGVF